MSSEFSFVPVYQTLAARHLFLGGSSSWRDTFPFTAPRGCWTFNGRVALHLGLKALGLPPNSTILVPSYFQGVEIETLLHNDHRLRFFRVNSRLEIDLDHVQSLLDHTVSALYVIHYFGFPQDMASIQSVITDRGIRLIEDCALSLFSKDGTQWLGSFGDMALFSVYKTLAVPHGGYLVLREHSPAMSLTRPPIMSTLAQVSDLVQNHWRLRGWQRLERAVRGMASAMAGLMRGGQPKGVVSGDASWDERVMNLDASPWVLRLMGHSHPEQVISMRRRNYELLSGRLRDLSVGLYPELPLGVCPLFFPALVPDKQALLDRLQVRGIGCVNLWWDSHPACPSVLSTEVQHLRQGILELPVHQSLSESEVDRVADVFREEYLRTRGAYAH